MKNTNGSSLPNAESNQDYVINLFQRQRAGKVWQIIFQISTAIGILVLGALLWNISDSAFGYAAIQNTIEPDSLAINGIPLEQLHPIDLTFILKENISPNVFRRLDMEKPLSERSRDDIYQLVIDRVVEPRVEKCGRSRNHFSIARIFFLKRLENFQVLMLNLSVG
ncbi:MAG: hypothetical protein HC806_08665 [Anaerolineae bacterium]|nr:hypothetical protein [Anaerolineae bacterium]